MVFIYARENPAQRLPGKRTAVRKQFNSGRRFISAGYYRYFRQLANVPCKSTAAARTVRLRNKSDPKS